MRVATEDELSGIALRHGAFKTASVEVPNIPFRREFRDACEKNLCGKYGANWMCPPDVGDIDDMIERARKHRRAFVFQSVAPLEDSFDAGGMREAAKKHLRLLQLIFSKIPVSWGCALKLGAGGCSVCDAPCAKSDGEPCRHPEKAIASMESYGIAVSELAERCGLQYVNGENTVTYFGAILYD